MDLIFILIVFILSVFFVRWRRNKIHWIESQALANEIEEDFMSDFERDSNGNLTHRGMEDLVLWCEDDMRERKLNQASEIESFEKLN
jgi:hypothetical protein